jgi:hypothetical protein
MKNCSNVNCKQVNPQPADRFYKTTRNRSGLTSRCIKCINAQTDAWVAKNRDKKRAAANKYANNNPDKVKQNGQNWNKNNPGKRAAQVRKRQAAKIQRTPKWLTKQQHKENEAKYMEAARLTKETGIPHEVDHILPLQGSNVSGLHVPWNLEVVPRSVNRRKSNKIA